MTEPNFSVLATSGDLESARQYIMGSDPASVASTVATAASKLNRGMLVLAAPSARFRSSLAAPVVPSNSCLAPMPCAVAEAQSTPRGLSRFLGRAKSTAAAPASSDAAKLEEALVDVQPAIVSFAADDVEEGDAAPVAPRAPGEPFALAVGASATMIVRVVPLRRDKTVVDVQHVPSPAFGREFDLRVTPARLVLKRQRAETFRVTVTARRANARLRELLAVAPAGGARMPVGVRADSVRAVFGVAQSTLETEQDLGAPPPALGRAAAELDDE